MKKNLTQDSTVLEWLVMFLVYNNASYDIEKTENENYIKMEHQKNSLFRAIKDSDSSEKIKIIIVEARIKELKGEYNQVIRVLTKQNNRLVDLPRPPKIRSAIALSEEWGISKILEYAVQSYPSKRHMVVTYGHGSVFGINYLPLLQPSLDKISEEKEKQLSLFKKQQPKNIAIWNKENAPKKLVKKIETELPNFKVSSQEETGLSEITGKKQSFNLLTNKELNDALKAVFPKGLDVLVMYNCLMQNLFTQFELCKTVKWLVAPVSGISYPGYNYRSVFEYLSADPLMTNEKVCGLFLDTADKNRKPTHLAYINDIEQTWNIHAVELNENLFVKIKESFKFLIDEIVKLEKTEPDILYSMKLVNRQVFNYAEYCLPEIKIFDLNIFLAFWLVKIRDFKAAKPLAASIKSMQKLLNKVKSHTFTGNSFYKTEYFYVDEEFISKGVNTGFGLWFTSREKEKKDGLFNTILHPSAKKDLAPSFITGTRYGDLLVDYIKRFN